MKKEIKKLSIVTKSKILIAIVLFLTVNMVSGFGTSISPKAETDNKVANQNQDMQTIWSDLFGGEENEKYHSVVDTQDGGYVSVGDTYSGNDDEAEADN